jgi:diacylglycerol kinase (ATP)
MRVTLIHNPTAGDETASGAELLTMIHDTGHEVIYQSIKKDDYKSALQVPTDLVVVAGGDGTVRKVAMRLIGCGVPIAILPFGTANNIAKTLGISGPPQELIRGWPSAHRVRFTVGLANGPWGEAPFLEGVGLGLFTTVMSMLDSSDDNLDQLGTVDEKLNRAVEVLNETLPKYPAQEVRVKLDGEDFSGKYLLLEAMNSKAIGPNLFLAPGADTNDDYLDFVFVSEEQREDFADYLSKRLLNSECSLDCTRRRGRHLRIESQRYEIRIDDLLWPRDADHFLKRTELTGSEPASVDIRLGNHLEFLVSD